jgi:hypothetical protein
MGSIIQSFKQKFPDKVTPEMIKAYHGGKSKIGEFTFDIAREHTDEIAGIMFNEKENTARKNGTYVTSAMLKLGRLVSTISPPRRDDVIYMIKNSPDRINILQKFDKNEREAFFKATDHIMKGGTAYNAYKIMSNEFYSGHPHEFVKNMVHVRYDGVSFLRKGETTYLIFNPKCISIVNQ